MKRSILQTILFISLSIIFANGQTILAKLQLQSKPNAKQSFDQKKINRKKTIFYDKTKSLPILFESNKEQFSENTNFFSRGNGFNLFLTSDEAIYQIFDSNCQPQPNQRKIENRKSCQTFSLKMKLLGANPNAIIQGVDEAITKTNYAIGNDQSKWLNNISNYNSVQYQNVYQGINLVFRGSEQNLEYDFHIASEADPNLIQLKFEGAKSFRLDADGNLVFKFKGIGLLHQKPFAYQIVDGQKVAVNVSYILFGKNRVGFKIGDYDKEKELIIDPLIYSTYLGGSLQDSAKDVAVDSAGNIYLASSVNSNNFLDPTLPGNGIDMRDTVVTKLDSTGTQILYNTFISGSK